VCVCVYISPQMVFRRGSQSDDGNARGEGEGKEISTDEQHQLRDATAVAQASTSSIDGVRGQEGAQGETDGNGRGRAGRVERKGDGDGGDVDDDEYYRMYARHEADERMHDEKYLEDLSWRDWFGRMSDGEKRDHERRLRLKRNRKGEDSEVFGGYTWKEWCDWWELDPVQRRMGEGGMEWWKRQKERGNGNYPRPNPDRADIESMDIEVNLLRSAKATMMTLRHMVDMRQIQAQKAVDQWSGAGREQWEIVALEKEVEEANEDTDRVQGLFEDVRQSERILSNRRERRG
jgi:hypothetical protein